MTSVPLLCNICPKEPEFSDISHLLTHVASKGHLAQELKAKVRGRQDASIREKLEVYDRWYKKNQIEKLLSQRLILKESKEASARPKHSVNSPSAGLAKNVRSSRKRVKSSDKILEASPVKPEQPPLIDPQLSWFPPSSPSPFLGLSEHGGLHQQDRAFTHRFHVPRMCEAQDASVTCRVAMPSTPPKISSCQKSPQVPGPDVDNENDYFNTFIRSPTTTAYPDPSELLGPSLGFSPPRTTDQTGKRASSTPDSYLRDMDKVELIQPPILKGVKWPGMSIFDSASLQAQRLRNQKKDGTIVEQMEHNSLVVEQMERIYWPDGSLKQERLITGNVESSPLKEPTPPPKRQRTRAKKNVLTDVSTNAPRLSRRAHKISKKPHNSLASELRDISKNALATLDPPPPQLVYTRNAHMGYDAANDEDFERRLTSGSTIDGRPQSFNVFNDNASLAASDNAMSKRRPEKVNAKADSYPFEANIHGHQGPTNSQAACFPARRNALAHLNASTGIHERVVPDGLPWDAPSKFFTNKSKVSMAEEDSENIEPILDGNGRIDDQIPLLQDQRVTQRYFSVTGNQPPQFYSSLPPHMDFGGLAEAKYYGSTLNLLNPYLRQHHIPPQYPPALFHHPAPSFVASRQDDIVRPMRSARAKDTGSKET